MAVTTGSAEGRDAEVRLEAGDELLAVVLRLWQRAQVPVQQLAEQPRLVPQFVLAELVHMHPLPLGRRADSTGAGRRRPGSLQEVGAAPPSGGLEGGAADGARSAAGEGLGLPDGLGLAELDGLTVGLGVELDVGLGLSVGVGVPDGVGRGFVDRLGVPFAG